MLHECWMIKSHRVFLKLYSSIFRSYSTFHNPSFQKLQTPTLSRAAEVRAGLEGVKLYLHCPSFKLLGIEGECVGEGGFFFSPHFIHLFCWGRELRQWLGGHLATSQGQPITLRNFKLQLEPFVKGKKLFANLSYTNKT